MNQIDNDKEMYSRRELVNLDTFLSGFDKIVEGKVEIYKKKSEKIEITITKFTKHLFNIDVATENSITHHWCNKISVTHDEFYDTISVLCYNDEDDYLGSVCLRKSREIYGI